MRVMPGGHEFHGYGVGFWEEGGGAGEEVADCALEGRDEAGA